MKQKRYPPFGYKIVNGEMKTFPREADLVRQIFSEYVSGASLQKLAESAAATGVRYRENVTYWNKNMLYRMLTDIRYCGEKGFPAIIAHGEFEQVGKLKQEKSTYKPCLPQLRGKMHCADCGGKLAHNRKTPPLVFWDCKGCGQRIGPIADDALLCNMTAAFNKLIQNPQSAVPTAQPHNVVSLETLRLTNEVTRALAQQNAEPEALLPLIFSCVEKKYSLCGTDETEPETAKLLLLLQNQALCEAFNFALFKQIVKRVILSRSSVQLLLKNSQTI